MDNIEWITLQEAPKFEINRLGEVRWIESQKLIRPRISKNGLLNVQLNLTNKPKRKSISPQPHTLVAKYFVPNPNNYKYIIFRNGDRYDHRAVNLIWSTNPNIICTKTDWIPVIDFPKYEINPLGNVRNIKTSVELTAQLREKTYWTALRRNGTRVSFQLNRLVAQHFVPNPNNCIIVKFKDGNRSNFVASNLEWVENPDDLDPNITWVDLKGFPKYEISTIGVRHKKKKSYINYHINDDGYPSIGIYRDKLVKTILLHRLIAIQFIPNPDNLPFVNHKNGDKMDFSVDNLEWVTSKRNNEHARETGLRPSNKGIGVKAIEELDEDGKVIFTFSGIVEMMDDIKMSDGNIMNIFANKLRDDGTVNIKGRIFRKKVIEDLDGEIWKDLNTKCEEYNTTYQVSNCGRVRHTLSKQILKSGKKRSGKTFVSLHSSNPKKSTPKTVARLVAFAFFDNDDRSLEVDHIDKNPANNNLDNLQLLTKQKHMEKDHGIPVISCDKEKKEYRLYPSMTNAEILNDIHSGTLYKVVKKNRIYKEKMWYRADSIEAQQIMNTYTKLK